MKIRGKIWHYLWGGFTVHLQIADEELLQFTASPLPGGLVSFTPAALHLLTYIKMSTSCTIMLTTVMQIAADLPYLCCDALVCLGYDHQEGTRFCVSVTLDLWMKSCSASPPDCCVHCYCSLMLAWNDSLSHYSTCSIVKFISECLQPILLFLLLGIKLRY